MSELAAISYPLTGKLSARVRFGLQSYGCSRPRLSWMRNRRAGAVLRSYVPLRCLSNSRASVPDNQGHSEGTIGRPPAFRHSRARGRHQEREVGEQVAPKLARTRSRLASYGIPVAVRSTGVLSCPKGSRLAPKWNHGGRHPLIGIIHRALPYEFDVSAPQSRDGQIRRSDTIFLVVVGILSLIASAVTFHIGRQQNAAIIAAGDDEDAPRTPLPAGPRKYR